MNVLFVNYHDFTSNSAIHIFNLANELTGLGVGCAVARPRRSGHGRAARHAALPGARLPRREARRASASRTAGRRRSSTPGRRGRSCASSPRRSPAALRLPVRRPPRGQRGRAHGRQPRPHARAAAGHVRATSSTRRSSRRSLAPAPDAALPRRRGRDHRHRRPPARVPARRRPGRGRSGPRSSPSCSPTSRRTRSFGAGSASPTARRCSSTPGTRTRRTPPSCGASTWRSAAVNRARPAGQARQARPRLRPLRRARAEGRSSEHVDPRAACSRASEVPRYMRLADVLVQPGRPDGFNDYRLPVEAARVLRDGAARRPAGDEPRPVPRGRRRVRAAPARRRARDRARPSSGSSTTTSCGRGSGAGARAFAERSFSWPASARKLTGFYDRVLGDGPGDRSTSTERRPCDRRALRRARPAAPGYATVRDYCDSVDQLPLACDREPRPEGRAAAVGAEGDRSAAFAPGSRLLEIGAGEPIVADLLARLGYDVTVVDPVRRPRPGARPSSTRSGRRYPRVRIVRGLFPRDVAGRRPVRLRLLDLRARAPPGRTRSTSVCAGIRRFARRRRAHDPRDRPRPPRRRATPSISRASAGSRARSGVADAELDQVARRARRRPGDVLPLRREPQPLARRRAVRRVPDAALRLDPAVRAGRRRDAAT